MITREQYDRWLEGLRSGAYIQTKGTLTDREKCRFCCLGVLADVIDSEAWDIGRTHSHWRGNIFLPQEILSDRIQGHLMRLNDSEGKNFLEIADWIEENITPETDTE